ncbi:hypothetical protein QQ020_11620 [Fulvivirgaceae bacterium BMA12]|uniref:Co-chaperone DjlA N-terminal domain-containing protein n=1 Tax=Agaribacillus aureus TaxID=3051825 RepID=A0ABT8L6Q2_9BACT|nr:hypothetical protein [Fulvivirgaceae bacterium BMA12]
MIDIDSKRKLNLLVHLARIDGKFHRAEKALLREFVNKEGLDVDDFHLLEMADEEIGDFHLIDDKKEMLFLALKLIQADDVIDKKEFTFCKEIAAKLGYNSLVIDQHAYRELDRETFDKTVNDWLL